MDASDTLVAVFLYATLTVLLVNGSIFEPLKQWLIDRIPSRYPRIEYSVSTLIYCSQCLGVWVGILGALVSGTAPIVPKALFYVLFASAVSTVALLIDRTIYGKHTD